MLKIKYRNLLILSVLGLFLAAGCVPQRKYQDLSDKYDNCKEQKEQLTNENEELTTSLEENKSELKQYKKRVDRLKEDTAGLSMTKRRLKQNYNELSKSYERLKETREEELSESKEESARILADLQETQQNILKQRDSLKQLENKLKKKEKNLEEMSQELAVSKSEMQEKQEKLNELQSVLDRKDSVVNTLKNKVNSALRGFEGEGLSIEERNGKVYVSMEEKLLFASGSYDISAQGKDALNELGGLLAENKDINIMVEGHTDSVPYSGKGQLIDNWDLSVKRATTVVRELLRDQDIDEERLIAAGRSKYVPLATNETSEGRAKNRRTEIILTPKLDELFNIIEMN